MFYIRLSRLPLRKLRAKRPNADDKGSRRSSGWIYWYYVDISMRDWGEGLDEYYGNGLREYLGNVARLFVARQPTGMKLFIRWTSEKVLYFSTSWFRWFFEGIFKSRISWKSIIFFFDKLCFPNFHHRNLKNNSTKWFEVRMVHACSTCDHLSWI